jgi:hypothetical protein
MTPFYFKFVKRMKNHNLVRNMQLRQTDISSLKNNIVILNSLISLIRYAVITNAEFVGVVVTLKLRFAQEVE